MRTSEIKHGFYKVITHYQVEHSKGGNAGVTRRKTPPEMFKRNFYM